jgi:hypothetical protein
LGKKAHHEELFELARTLLPDATHHADMRLNPVGSRVQLGRRGAGHILSVRGNVTGVQWGAQTAGAGINETAGVLVAEDWRFSRRRYEYEIAWNRI